MAGTGTCPGGGYGEIEGEREERVRAEWVRARREGRVVGPAWCGLGETPPKVHTRRRQEAPSSFRITVSLKSIAGRREIIGPSRRRRRRRRLLPAPPSPTQPLFYSSSSASSSPPLTLSIVIL